MDHKIERLLRRQEVEHLTGLSKSTLYAMIADSRFPSPVRISSHAVRWRASDIAAWQKNLPVADGGRNQEGE